MLLIIPIVCVVAVLLLLSAFIITRASHSHIRFTGDTLLIHEPNAYHYEVVESVIANRERMGYDPTMPVDLYIPDTDPTFRAYFSKYYPWVNYLKEDPGFKDRKYVIHLTRYVADLKKKPVMPEGHSYILHDYDRAWDSIQCWYISPHGPSRRSFIPDTLPFSAKSPSFVDRPPRPSKPVFIVQGRYAERDWGIVNASCSDAYNVVAIGNGKIPRKARASIEFRPLLSFIEYHKVAASASGIIMAINQVYHNHYYTHILTSSASYAVAYNLECICDDVFYKIYKSFGLLRARPRREDALVLDDDRKNPLTDRKPLSYDVA